MRVGELYRIETGPNVTDPCSVIEDQLLGEEEPVRAALMLMCSPSRQEVLQCQTQDPQDYQAALRQRFPQVAAAMAVNERSSS